MSKQIQTPEKQIVQQSPEKQISERKEINEYIASMTIEEEKENLNAIFNDLYVLPIVSFKINHHNRKQKATLNLINNLSNEYITDMGWMNVSYICKLYIPTRDEYIYIRTQDNEELFNLFSKNFKISNCIDQNLLFDEPNILKIESLNEYDVKFKNIENELKYNNSLIQSIKSQIHYRKYASTEDVINIDELINNEKFDDILLENILFPDVLLTTKHIFKNHINNTFNKEKNNLKKSVLI